jgi:uncharacterized protein with FMN-binding domain
VRRILLTFMTTLAAVIALLGYRTSTPNPASAATSTVAAAPASTGSGSTTTTAPAPTGTTALKAATRTVIGSTADTRWGPVQVQLTVSAGKITAVDLLQVPSSNGRDVEINSYAVPVLTQETLTAQSASIDSVSGATYTSDGYITSLQSALDKAGL